MFETPKTIHSSQSSAMRLSVKVVPKASRDSVAGWLGDTLKITVRAPAEGGKANAAVEEILGKVLGIPKCARIIAGKTSPRKIVEISGLSEAEVRERLRASRPE